MPTFLLGCLEGATEKVQMTKSQMKKSQNKSSPKQKKVKKNSPNIIGTIEVSPNEKSQLEDNPRVASC